VKWHLMDISWWYHRTLHSHPLPIRCS